MGVIHEDGFGLGVLYFCWGLIYLGLFLTAMFPSEVGFFKVFSVKELSFLCSRPFVFEVKQTLGLYRFSTVTFTKSPFKKNLLTLRLPRTTVQIPPVEKVSYG